MHRLRRSSPLLLTALLAALLILTLAACGGSGNGSTAGGSPSATPSGAGISVSIADYTYAPQSITIPAGTAVTWTNEDSVIHTVTSADGSGTDAGTTDLFDSGSMGKGDTFSYTFTEPGTYDYLCVPHRSMAGMHAQVVVE